MISKSTTKITLAAGAAAATAAQANLGELDQAFKMLKTYDWGSDRKALDPIDRAITDAQGNAAALKPLEKALIDALASGISRSAQDYVCRRLRVIGTSESVAALAALLGDEETSHIARYAVERIADEKAIEALRAALPKVNNKLKVGMIGSLGSLRDEKSIETLAALLGDSDALVAEAAAQSLGLIGTSAAANQLKQLAKKASDGMKKPVGDACLVCAERLLASGKKAEAIALYKELASDEQPANIKAAATKGMLTAATAR